MTRPHKTAMTAWLGPRTEWIDWFALCNVLALIALPHYALLRLPVSTYTVWGPELIYGLLSATSVACIALRGKSIERILFGLFVAIVIAVYFVLSVAVLKHGLAPCMSQVRYFLPFIAASLLVNTDWNLKLSQVIKCVAIVCAASGMIAIILNLALPDFYQTLHEDNAVINNMAAEGRMYWTPAAVALLVPIIFVVPMRWFLRLLILIFVTSAVAMTQSRTLLFVFSGLTLVMIAHGSRSHLKTFGFIAFALLLIAALLYSIFDEQMIDGFMNRLGLNDTFSSAIETATIDSRGEVFNYYIYQLQSYKVLGGGFGRPLFILADQTPIFTSDVSILSFYFPMGLVGLCLLFTFWWICWKRIRAASRDLHVHRVAVGLQWVLCIACIVSLNLDIFSRNLFVVLLAFLIAILRSNHFQSCNANSYKLLMRKNDLSVRNPSFNI